MNLKLLRENGCFDIATRVKHPASILKRMEKSSAFLALYDRKHCGPILPVTLSSAEKVIEKYVRHYNNNRLHSAIGYVAPVEVFKGTEEEIFRKKEEKRSEAKKRRIAINRMRWHNSSEALPA